MFLQDLILDQTIEKVSFCAPDRNFERAFSYICRDGTTRRWICHCFMAIKDSVRTRPGSVLRPPACSCGSEGPAGVFQGERLSHAVGCAFAACLERKQKREKECGVTATFDANRTTFTREGSFRVTTATEAAEREEVMRQLQDVKKGQCETAVQVSGPCGPVTAALWSLCSGGGRDGGRKPRKLRDKPCCAAVGKPRLPFILAAPLCGRAGPPGHPAQTRPRRGAGAAGLLQRLPGTQPEDVAVQTPHVAAHERAALHHAAPV